MATAKKKTTNTKKTPRVQPAKPTKKLSLAGRAKQRVTDFLARRPHRSFRRTRRRDYARSLKLPGYWSFMFYVTRTVWSRKGLFLVGALVFTVLSAVLVGMGSQENFATAREALGELGGGLFEGNWGKVGEAGVLALAGAVGGVSPTLSEVQQVYSVIIGLIVWLTTVWLLRRVVAGDAVRFRDGLYNAMSPLVATGVVFLVLVVQLLPVALGLIVIGAAQNTGILNGGVEAMLAWVAFGFLVLLSLYWLAATLMACVIVTLPGMYPGRALRIAGDMVVGRRLRLLYRMLWMILWLLVAWFVILIPVVLFDGGIKQWLPALDWLPIVPAVVVAMTVLSLMWSSSYIYLLYRKVVDDDAKPA